MAGRRDARPVPPELRAQDLRLFHYLQDLREQGEDGIPAGFLSVTPTQVSAAPGSTGTEDVGWAAADHQHALDASGTPGDYVDAPSAQGAGPGASLSGHTHQIPDNALTLAKLQKIASSRFLGRITFGIGNVELLTTAQVTSLLDIFTDLLNGLVPASGGGTANFLRADGAWAPLNPVLRPAQVTADQNDYSPGTLGQVKTTVFSNTDASRNFTGILATGAVDGTELVWINNGAQNEVLQNENAGSAAGNRLICPGAADLTLAATEAVMVVRDATATRWRVFRL